MTAALWTSLATIVGVWFVTVLSPGPNFFATLQAATQQSRRAGIVLSLGIAVGTTAWATFSLLGLGVLFQSAAWAYQALKLAGAAYLIYLGLQAVLTARRPIAVIADGQATNGRALSAGRLFLRGLVVDLSNPKAAVFFTSLFAVTVPPAAPLWFQALVVAAVVAMAGGWYAVVACLVDWRPVAALLGRGRRLLSYVTGAVFIALGIRLAVDD